MQPARIFQYLLQIEIWFYFICIHFVWITIYKLGSFDLRLYHLPLISALPFLLLPRYINNLLKFIYHYRILIGSYTCLLLLNLFSLLWTSEVGAGRSFIIKALVYYSYFFLFAGVIYSFLRQRRTIRSGNQYSYLFLVFSGIIALIFQMQGLSLFGEIFNAITQGNYLSITYKFLPILFKFNFITSTVSDEWMNSRNILAVSFAFSLVCIIAFDKKNIVFYTASITNIIALLIILSRSGQLYFLIIILFLVVFILKKSYRLSLLLLLPIVLALSANSIKNSFLLERYSSIEDEPRLFMYEETILQISYSPIIGYGVGTPIRYKEARGRVHSSFVHNFILGSWFTSGIMGLFLSVLFLGVLLYTVIQNHLFMRKLYCTFFGNSRVQLISVLPIFLIIRIMVGGNYGIFGLIEFSILATYLATCFFLREKYKNRLLSK